MGIRPSLYILVGIDDAVENDPRLKPVDFLFLEQILNFRNLETKEFYRNRYHSDAMFAKHDIPGYSKALYHLLYNPTGNFEYSAPGVVGLILSHSEYDSNFVRALATMDEKFLSTGSQRIPTSPSITPWQKKIYGYTTRDINCNRVVDSVFENSVQTSRLQWARARHYLKLVGWHIPETDLRYLLVWEWS